MPLSDSPSSLRTRGFAWGMGTLTLAIVIAIYVVGWFWSLEPDQFDVEKEALVRANKTTPRQLPLGYVFSNTLAHIAEELLNKPGGYVTNDVAPPGLLLDNITNWEFGALVMLRDSSSALRNHFARSQSQSSEDPDLAKAEPYFYYENNSWALPSTESEYQKGINSLHKYMERLGNRKNNNPAQFYARADNLRQYLEVVEKRLGGISSRLSASTERHEIGSSLGNRENTMAQTPWLQIDDIFYEARGASWALVHILKAVEYDFHDILVDKHALATLQRIIHELELALTPVMSPMILNGDGFGLFANYSLTMANYITRANAAALDLRDIMMRG
ncbi:MAG: DUF2333 family protein [Gammaproteobacteria bacterium]